VIQIDVLPDDVLLGIFDFYVDMHLSSNRVKTVKMIVEDWQSLVHVCRRWRNLVLGSPRRLNLRLYCTPETPARDTLDVWPPLPLIVYGDMKISLRTDNVIAALGQNNHVCEVDLRYITGWQLEEVLAAMQVPFPELTNLWLSASGETQPVIPDSFLDGSAQRLRYFHLDGIPFPGLPKLLFSANHLDRLWLYNIPHSGYISPEAMVALLSVLSSLSTLNLKFQSPQSRPDWETRPPPPSKRSVIPALMFLDFKGVTEYLEDLVTGIDTPQLFEMDIDFFNQIDFDTPRLAQFINRTLKLKAHDKARVLFRDDFVLVGLLPGNLQIEILCREPDWQLSSIEQICNSSLRPFSTVEGLYIDHQYSELVWKDDAIENTLWLQLLLPFTAMKYLYLSKEFAPGIAAALQELVGGRITEVLPSLRYIFVEGLEPSGPFRENIEQFVAARQLSNHPIAISGWDNSYDTESM
jgi:F-box-like